MLGVHVETIDPNLPVDAITEKPLFAFSCNRIIRENYSGPLMRATDGTDIGVDDLSANAGKSIDKLYDQKSRFGHSAHDVSTSGPYPTLALDGSVYCLEFDGTQSLEVGASQYLSEAGIFVVCDPEGQGRQPIVTASNSTHELSLDLGTAYMRFALYELTAQESLFGGLDYPDQPRDGYVANYGSDILLTTVRGNGGEAEAGESIPALTSMHIGKDEAGNKFEGKLYELVICDFTIPSDAKDEVFSDWQAYYGLT